MSVHSQLIGEFLRWSVLGFMAPIDWESSKQHWNIKTKMWPWVVLFAVLALGQLAIGVLHPRDIVEALATT
jgi:hypothetical protein